MKLFRLQLQVIGRLFLVMVGISCVLLGCEMPLTSHNLFHKLTPEQAIMEITFLLRATSLDQQSTITNRQVKQIDRIINNIDWPRGAVFDDKMMFMEPSDGDYDAMDFSFINAEALVESAALARAHFPEIWLVYAPLTPTSQDVPDVIPPYKPHDRSWVKSPTVAKIMDKNTKETVAFLISASWPWKLRKDGSLDLDRVFTQERAISGSLDTSRGTYTTELNIVLNGLHNGIPGK